MLVSSLSDDATCARLLLRILCTCSESLLRTIYEIMLLGSALLTAGLTVLLKVVLCTEDPRVRLLRPLLAAAILTGGLLDYKKKIFINVSTQGVPVLHL